MKHLPEIAYATLGTEPGHIIALRRGESGYYSFIKFPNEDLAKRYAERLNAEAGVTPPQLQAMRAGSMFGWDCPGADPDSYEADGDMKLRD
jgi:hypothetical protein